MKIGLIDAELRGKGMTRSGIEDEVRRIFQWEQLTFDGKVKKIAELIYNNQDGKSKTVQRVAEL